MSIPFKQSPQATTYVTEGKLNVTRRSIPVDSNQALQGIIARIDQHQGALFSSGYEFPGRYSRWDVGFLNPPLELRSMSNRFELKALNSRGELLLDFIFSHLNRMKSVMLHRGNTLITGSIESLSEPEFVLEENRTKQPTRRWKTPIRFESFLIQPRTKRSLRCVRTWIAMTSHVYVSRELFKLSAAGSWKCILI